MIIRVLAENTSSSKNFSCEHGLCLYIETKKHKLLFDTGASGLFAENALKMKVDLKEVDLVVISHGHHDHGGGLKTFLAINSQAKIYLQEKAFEKHYGSRPNGEMEYIGLEDTLLPNERFVLTGENLVLDDELELFAHVSPKKLNPSGNKALYMKAGEDFVHDDFQHEQNLIISENGKTVLIAGCAHNGIVNIVERFQAHKGFMPEAVIGGFHLFNPSFKKSEEPEVTDDIGRYLLNTNSMYFTCHCTGLESYERLKAVMGARIAYLSTGTEITI